MKFNVRNVAQQALMLCELQGQFSDGMWENSARMGNSQEWRDRTDTVGVATGEAELGRDFNVRYDGFNVNSSELLEIIGGRMLSYARIARERGIEAARMCGKHGTESDDPRKDGSPEDTYNMKDMRADLRDIQNTMKVRI